MLYSFQSATPAPLPHRIRLPDASTRTDSDTFTPEELEAAGYAGPFERPSCDETTEIVDWDGSSFLVRPYNDVELEAQWQRVREQRLQLLQSSDWTQIADYDLGADRQAWATYRQQLRDITLQPNPFAIVWPIAPAFILPEG